MSLDEDRVHDEPTHRNRGRRAANGNLKNVEEQVIVITGASSGIGLTTARMAAERGARLVLAARSEDALQDLTEEITQGGGEAVYVAADVSDRDDVREIARVAEETYGGFDTWVNVAGVFIYGKLEDTPVEDMRRQFETNVWGLLYGSLEAADRLKERGGAIINIGSALSDRALLLQGSYSASKHAVKGFTDALRMELEEEDAPVSVTLIKPSAIDTPYTQHAKNYMDKEAQLPPPIYAPETVARAILHSAENPERDVFVGAGGKSISMLGYYASSLMDTIMEKVFFPLQRKDDAPRPREQNSLDGPAGHLEERGGYEGHVAERSLYTEASLRRRASAVVAGIAVVAALLYARYRAARGKEKGST
jgi:short-subunit dehydrogenase